LSALSQTKPPQKAQDSCRAILTVLEKGKNGQACNIGGGNERKNIDIAKEILRRLPLPETMIEFISDRPGHDFRYSELRADSTLELDAQSRC
jgi:dTDP-D-glucose 4,6-dehydratase